MFIFGMLMAYLKEKEQKSYRNIKSLFGFGFIPVFVVIFLQGENQHHCGINCKARSNDNSVDDGNRTTGRVAETGGNTAEQPGDGEGTNAGRAVAGGLLSHPPASLKSDQETDPKRQSEPTCELKIQSSLHEAQPDRGFAIPI